MRAYKQLAHYESRSSFATWLYRIAANYSLDLMRRRKRHEDRRETAGNEDWDPIASLPASEPGPDRLVYSSEVQQSVSAAMDQLSEQERAAFVLRHFEGLSIEDIGQALGTSQNATKHSIFRAVQKLRRSLEPLVSPARS